MFKACLLLGGNLGDREELLSKAIEALKIRVGNIIVESSIYETSAWGNENQPNFLNKVVIFYTKLSAFEVLNEIQQIEIELGRTRHEHWGARTIDIDILFFDNEIIDTKDLKIPHPLINMRIFVLRPLLEIIPDYIHPGLKKSIKELYLICEDKLEVSKFITDRN